MWVPEDELHHEQNPKHLAKVVIMGKNVQFRANPRTLITITEWMFDPQTSIDTIPAWSSVFSRKGRLSLDEAYG